MKKNKFGGNNTTCFKIYYKAALVKKCKRIEENKKSRDRPMKIQSIDILMKVIKTIQYKKYSSGVK